MPQSYQTIPPSESEHSRLKRNSETSDVLVFVDDVGIMPASAHHAQKVARAFGGKVIFVKVLSETEIGNGPVDPVEWNILKQRTLMQLESLAKKLESANQLCGVELLEGQCANKIKSFIEHRKGDIAASLRNKTDVGWQLSETGWGVLLSQSAAVMMIPNVTQVTPEPNYQRILLPLDGSSRAEIALQRAIQLARVEDAELMLCYVIPDHGLTGFGPNDQEAERLHRRVRKQNEQAGRNYLAGIKGRLEHNGLKISVKVSLGADVRRALIDIIFKEKVDFVVMATHGQSGYRDVPTGDVARFILGKANVPVLLVRARNGRDSNHTFNNALSAGTRLPAGTD